MMRSFTEAIIEGLYKIRGIITQLLKICLSWGRQQPWLRSDWLYYATGLILLSLMMMRVFVVRSFNADDVAVQVMLRQIDLTNPLSTWVGPQTFVLKYPLFWLLNDILPSSRWSILLTAWLQVVIGYSLYFGAATSLLRTLKMSRIGFRLGLLWMLSSSSLLFTYLINPDYRNMEIGLAMTFVAWVLARLYRAKARSVRSLVWQGGLWIICLSLLLASDAMFLYMVMAPLGLFLLLRLLYRDQEGLTIYLLSLIGLSVIGMAVVGKVMAWYGIEVVNPTNGLIAQLEHIQAHTMVAIHSVLSLHDAYFFELASGGSRLELIHTVLNAAIVLLSLVSAALFAARKDRSWGRLWLIGQPLLIITIFIFSTRVFDYGPNTRYLNSIYVILVPFYLPFLLAYTYQTVGQFKPRLAMIGLMIMAITAGLGWQAVSLNKEAKTAGQPNAIEHQLIERLRAEDLDKGYAGFWEAGIVSYFADDKPLVIQMTCNDQGVDVHHWYLNQTRLNQPAERSFIIHSNRSNEMNCSLDQLAYFVGPAVKTIPVNAELTILVYNRDIFNSQRTNL